MSDASLPARMTIDQLEQVLSMAFQDPNLAQKLQADPEGTLKSLGYPTHHEEITFFRKLSLVSDRPSDRVAVADVASKDSLADKSAEC